MASVKLTLSIPDSILAEAKAFSARTKKSISQMVAEYLSSITRKDAQKMVSPSTHPLVLKMTGIAKPKGKYAKMSDKELLTTALQEKHLK